jgi:hypothetical protein
MTQESGSKVIIHGNNRRCLLPAWGVKQNGQHFYHVIRCKSYACDTCGPWKLGQKLVIFSDATLNLDVVYEIKIENSRLEAVTRTLTHKKCPSLRVRFRDGSVLIFTDRHFEGRNWIFNKIATEDAIMKLGTLNPKEILRIDPTSYWKPEIEPSFDRVKLRHHQIFSSFQSMHERLGKVGIDPVSSDQPIDIDKMDDILKELADDE